MLGQDSLPAINNPLHVVIDTSNLGFASSLARVNMIYHDNEKSGSEDLIFTRLLFDARAGFVDAHSESLHEKEEGQLIKFDIRKIPV